MAEIQKTNSVSAGEMAQRFAQFVIMHTQQILFVLGAQTPEGESMPPNLEGGRILIDQLEMIHEKTKGNLSTQEASLLEEALTRVRLAFVQASGSDATPHSPSPTGNAPTSSQAEGSHSAPEQKKSNTPATPAEPTENRKKFSKTYG